MQQPFINLLMDKFVINLSITHQFFYEFHKKIDGGGQNKIKR